MPRPKGIEKTGGRKKGTPNKVNKDAKELLAEYAPQLLQKAIDLALNEGDRVILNKLLDKIIPSLTAVEQKLDVNSLPKIEINVRDN